jgi:hypothetical protein
MDTTTEDVAIPLKLAELNLSFPEGLAFLPENIDASTSVDDFVFPEPLRQIRKLFRANNLEFTILGKEATRLRARKNADLYLPSLFVGISLLSQNPAAISVALSVLANYVTDFFKGTVGSRKVSFEIYVEKADGKTVTKISYKGNGEGIKNLEGIIKKLE